MEEDQPHSSLRTSIHPCRPKRRHLFTEKHQQGVFHILTFYMNKVIILRRKKLRQFFSLLPQMAQATHFVSGDFQLVSSPLRYTWNKSVLGLIWAATGNICLSPEHLRHWMLWSTEDTETLKCVLFFFLNLNALRATHPTSQTETSFHRTFKLMDEEWMIGRDLLPLKH